MVDHRNNTVTKIKFAEDLDMPDHEMFSITRKFVVQPHLNSSK